MLTLLKTETQVDSLIQVMKKHDLDISGYDPFFIIRSIDRRLQAIQCESATIYYLLLEQNTQEAKALFHSLRVGYSMFFRDAITFALLEQRILPDLIERREKSNHPGLRIWSAGCSAGQEAWSIAILLNGLCENKPHFNWRIFATDFYATDLEFARTGIYSPAEVGNVRFQHLNTAFTLQNTYYAIGSHLRERVEFSLYDLLDPTTSCPPNSIFGDFDLIFCCNVLLYYRVEQQRQILNKLMHGLAPNGYLITGETERQLVARESHMHETLSAAPIFQRR